MPKRVKILSGSIPARYIENLRGALIASTHWNVRRDGVDARTWGAFHFEKSISAYRESIIDWRSRDTAVIKASTKCGRIARSAVAAYIGMPIARPANIGDVDAPCFRFSIWGSSGQFSLPPHNDVDQVKRYIGESNDLGRVIPDTMKSVVLMIQQPDAGGELRVWNRPRENDVMVSPDKPTGVLDQFDDTNFVDYGSQVGDIVVFDSALVHAVTAVQGDVSRIVGTAFVAVTVDAELIWWT
ncbi:MAG: 2OG-Fe(II) oxygenase [Rhizobiaceae bacterium]